MPLPVSYVNPPHHREILVTRRDSAVWFLSENIYEVDDDLRYTRFSLSHRTSLYDQNIVILC